MTNKTIAEILLAYASVNDEELGEDKFDGHYDLKIATQALNQLILQERINQIREIKASDVQLNINTRDLLSHMSQELNAQLEKSKP